MWVRVREHHLPRPRGTVARFYTDGIQSINSSGRMVGNVRKSPVDAEHRRNWRWEEPVVAKSTNTQITWGEEGKGIKKQGLKEHSFQVCLEKSNKAS